MLEGSIILLLLGIVMSAVLTGIFRLYAIKNTIMDIPNERSSHNISKPRGGGIAIVFVFLLSTLILFLIGKISQDFFVGIFLSSIVVAAIGFWDDHHSLGRRKRIFVHLVAAIWLFYWIGGLGPIPILKYEVDLDYFGDIIGIIALIWLLNLYNFMDGIDGIASIETISVIGSTALILYINGEKIYTIWSLTLVSSCIGFLIWNWPPAKIFLGDVGSGFLGLTLGGFALITSNNSVLTVWTWLILLGVFIVDATATLITRMIGRIKWYDAHRSHAYQHAAMKYNSHRKITLLVLLINVCWLFPWALISVEYPEWGLFFMIIAFIPLLVIVHGLGAGKDLNRKNMS